MSKSNNRNKNNPAGNYPTTSKAISLPKPNWSVIWSNLTDAIARHPIVSSIIGGCAVATVGGGIYLSHDVMEHDYDAEFNFLDLVDIKLNRHR